MTPTALGLVTALFFLVMGVVEYVVFLRAAYSARDDDGQTLDPNQPVPSGARWITRFIGVQSFVFMPVLGYVLGSRFLPSLTGNH